MEEIEKVLNFIIEIEKLKNVLRKTMPVGLERFENSAEHSWHVCMSAPRREAARSEAREARERSAPPRSRAGEAAERSAPTRPPVVAKTAAPPREERERSPSFWLGAAPAESGGGAAKVDTSATAAPPSGRRGSTCRARSHKPNGR